MQYLKPYYTPNQNKIIPIPKIILLVDPKLMLCIPRYQFYLQVKLDILQGRLPVQEELSTELAALALQCKLCVTGMILKYKNTFGLENMKC